MFKLGLYASFLSKVGAKPGGLLLGANQLERHHAANTAVVACVDFSHSAFGDSSLALVARVEAMARE